MSNILSKWKNSTKYSKDVLNFFLDPETYLVENNELNEHDVINTLARCKSHIIECKCGKKLFYRNQDETIICSNCNEKLEAIGKVELLEYRLTLYKDTRIYKCQVVESDLDSAMEVLFKVVEDEEKRYWLLNLTEEVVKAKTTNGDIREVAPNVAIPIKSGIEIYYNEGKISIE